MEREGVTKFVAEHSWRSVATRHAELACILIAWRAILAKTELLGQDPARYDGAGFGNVSGRVGPRTMPFGARAMLISGTQTGGRPDMTLDDFCVVERYDDHRNWVRSHGRVAPSSETMTHGAIYDLSPAIRFVLHAHSPVLWRQAHRLRIPTSDPRISYGTREMAQEARRLYASSTLPVTRILAMGGHQDGIIVFGESAEQAGQTLIGYLARAYATVCGGGGAASSSFC